MDIDDNVVKILGSKGGEKWGSSVVVSTIKKKLCWKSGANGPSLHLGFWLMFLFKKGNGG